MKIDIYQVDAFSGKAFEGNPAAVCPLDKWLPDEIMQQIAVENNLSETAFFVNEGDGFRLRWFTPKTEVDLCGHATLATAHVLFAHLNYGRASVSFTTKSGELSVDKKENGRYAMNFPVKLLRKETVPEPVKRAIGNTEIKDCFKADDYLLIVENERLVRDLKPDFGLLAEVDARGIIVSAPGTEVDFVSRFFAPRVGVPEDPVTGSAHTMLTPYWAKKLNKKKLNARQVSARGGDLQCKLLDDGRVEISGQACTFMVGEISISE